MSFNEFIYEDKQGVTAWLAALDKTQDPPRHFFCESVYLLFSQTTMNLPSLHFHVTQVIDYII